MRVLITGASGFAGGHLARHCVEKGDDVVGISRRGSLTVDGASGLAVDIREEAAVVEAIDSARPEVIYHLAALSHVGRSWENPARTLSENVAGAVVVLEAVRRAVPTARLVWASTCEVYGPPERLPVEESAPLQPANPYAVSKAAGDMLARVYAQAHGLDIVRARPFNHAGPGQLPIFIVSSLARQVAEARIGGAPTVRILTGNPDTRRDFTDVRDVARAYRLLATSAPAGVYNISSGVSVSARVQIDLLRELVAPLQIEHHVDPERVRAHEVIDLRGDNRRLRDATGWRPEIPFKQTMLDTVRWWEAELG